MTQNEEIRLFKLLDIISANPTSAVAEGYRRNCNLFDELSYIYSSVSSGKDSLFMSQMAITELMRRQWVTRLSVTNKEKADDIMKKFTAERVKGLASHNEDKFDLFTKWVYPGNKDEIEKRKAKFINKEIVKRDISEVEAAIGVTDTSEAKIRFLERLDAPVEYYENMRIGVLCMEYELSFDQSNEVMNRFAKEYATDIRNIEPDHTIDLEKSVKENGYDLRWVDDNHKKNPHEKTREEIENMKPYELAEIYGKAVIWFYDCHFSIAWENNGGVDESRYISYDPTCKHLWVNQPPTHVDPYHEWCMTNENLYDSWFGLRPPVEIRPAMSDQLLRVEFSKYISEAVSEGFKNGWPLKKYNINTGKYE